VIEYLIDVADFERVAGEKLEAGVAGYFFVGRPALWGLAAGGEAGARRVLEILRHELELTLALCGCASPAELTHAQVQRAPVASVYSL